MVSREGQSLVRWCQEKGGPWSGGVKRRAVLGRVVSREGLSLVRWCQEKGGPWSRDYLHENIEERGSGKKHS